MSIRLLFSWGLVALFALLSLLIPRELLPTEEINAFSTLESVDIYAGSAQDPAALYNADGDVVLFNLSTVFFSTMEASWRMGGGGSQRADGQPLMRYESLGVSLGISGTEQVTVSAFDSSGALLAQGSFVHDFSADPLVLVLRDSEQGLPIIEPFDNQTP